MINQENANPETMYPLPFSIRVIHGILLRISPNFMWKYYLQISDLFLSLANLLITRKFKGVHPKHAIMQYEKFFLRFIDKNDVVLDVGSGTGLVAYKIAEVAQYVTGVELVDKKILFAKNNHSRDNIEFINIDIHNFLPTKKYSVCVMSNVLEHIHDRKGLLTKITKLCDILLIRVPAIDRDWWPIFRRDNGIEWRSDITHFTEYTEEELVAELKESGWTVSYLERRWGELYVKCSRS